MNDRPSPTVPDPHPVVYDDLIAYAAGTLGRSAAVIAAHVAGCPDCAAVVARYRLVCQTVRTDAAIGPSAAAVARVRNLAAGLRRPEPKSPSPRAALRRLVAALTFDGWANPAPAGLRGDGDGYVLAYAADGIEVDLEVSPDPGSGGRHWQVMGQVAGSAGLARAEVVLAAPSQSDPIVRSATDDEGIFTLQAGSGRYDLHLRLPEGLLVLPDVHLEPRS